MIRRGLRHDKLEIASYKGKRFRGVVRWIAAAVLAAAVAFCGLLSVVLIGAHSHIQGQPQVMIVLGCQVKPWGPSVLLQDRLDAAVSYWETHPDITVVVSGGQGPDEPTTEAQAMADYLVERGVAREDILLEDRSHSTHQNLLYTMERLKEEDVDLSQGVLVVSNGFHLARARMLAQRAGFGEVSTLAAPTSHLPSRLKMYIREPVALVKSFIIDR